MKYTADLPWNLSGADIERLRELGAVKFVYEVEGESRRSIIRELSQTHQGWRDDLSEPAWWSQNLSRGRQS